MIDNVLGANQYTIRKEKYKKMKESNRSSFYLKYFNDFREVKKNVVGCCIYKFFLFEYLNI